VGEQEGEPCANEHSEKASHGGDRKSNYHFDNLMLNDRPPHERLAGEYNVAPATITRDGKFAEAVDSIAAPVSEYARSIFSIRVLLAESRRNGRSSRCVAFRDEPTLQTCGVFWDMPHAKRPTFNTAISAP